MGFNNVTVTTTATKILDPNELRLSLIVVNSSAETVYIGQDDTVTTSNGVPMVQDATLTEDNSGGTRGYMGPLYGIVATGTADVRYWERDTKR